MFAGIVTTRRHKPTMRIHYKGCAFMSLSLLHHRLRQAIGTRSYREVGELTRVHAETVRRYMTGQTPSTEFVIEVAEATGVNVGWLLTGDGPMYRKDVKLHALRDANPTELLHAVAQTLEALIERVDRPERFIMDVDARARVASTIEPRPDAVPGLPSGTHGQPANGQTPAGSPAPLAAPLRQRAISIVDQVFPKQPQRPADGRAAAGDAEGKPSA
jgi:transcriptional regulator with XRE-family HTH domain